MANLLAVGRGEPLFGRYDGYSSCPVTIARNRMLLAEFDYQLKPQPSFPFIDTMKHRYDMWLLKRYGLPALYWHGMMRGLADQCRRHPSCRDDQPGTRPNLRSPNHARWLPAAGTLYTRRPEA